MSPNFRNFFLTARIVFITVLLAGCSSYSGPPVVAIDRSFNLPLGYALFTPQAGFSSRGVEAGLQSDGKIVVMGSTVKGVDDDILLVRYLADGRLDAGFGSNGYVRYGNFDRDRGLGLAILSGDDSIIVTGYSTINGSRELLTVRFSSTGTVLKDMLYSDLGTDIGFGITITPDQMIVVIGESSSFLSKKQDMLVLRMDANLQLDSGFGEQGVVHYNGPGNENEKGFGVAAQPDGSLLACGAVIVSGKEDMLLIRLKPDGSLDPGFGAGGSFIWSSPSGGADYANNLALNTDGSIVIAGAASTGTGYQIAVIRVLSSGVIDAGFGQGGVVVYSGLTGADAYPYGVLIQQNGGIVIAGSSAGNAGVKNAVALRFTPDGRVDPSFGGNGVIVFEAPDGGDAVANGMTMQPDQSLLIAGYANDGQYDSALIYRLSTSVN